MNKTQKIILASLVALIAIALVFVFSKSKQPANVEKSQKQSITNQSNSQVKNQATTQEALQPLPADDKKAIDTELDNIEKELKSTDNIINSEDLSDANLGL